MPRTGAASSPGARTRQGRQPFSRDEALEPIVGEYLSSIGPTQAMFTLRRRVAAIVRQARLAQVPFDTGNPHVRETLRGIARKHTGDKRPCSRGSTAAARTDWAADSGSPVPTGINSINQRRKSAR